MASEAGILESIAEKKVQDETGDFGCAQIHNPPEYTNKPLEVLKEHSNESEIKGGLTDSAVLQSSQMIGQYPPYEAVTATGESSTLSESSNDQSAHSVTVGITDSSEGEVFVEAPPRVQVHLEDICNGSNAGIHGENPINKEKEKLENGNMLRKDKKDELEEEKDMTVPKNSSSEANFTDASLHTAAVTNVPLEEKMQRNESNDFGNDHPVKKSDEHIFESTGANQNTEKADVLGEENTSTGIHENSVINQYQDLENLGDKVDDKQLEKSINLGHEKQDFEAIKDQEKPETQESTENLSVNPERLPLPEDLGETGLQKEDEENDRFDDLSGPLSEEQCDKDDQRVSMENYHEKEDIIGIVSSNETSQSQNIASVKDKEEKLEESSFLASEEKILESLDITEKVSEIQYGKTSADASLKELSNLKLSAEESALEDDMSSDTVKKLSFKEQEPIQRTRVIIIETETSKEETHTEMDPHKCTSQMKKEPEESNFIEDSMADKDVECISLVSTEKSPGTSYASKNIENENLDESKQDGWMDASISTKVEVPGIQNDQVSIMTHKETYNVLYEENGLQANDPMDAGDDFKKGENLNEQAKAKSEEEKFEEVCRVVEALDTRETVATAISMDEPHVVSAEDIIQDQETTHSRNEKENEVQEEEETNYRNIDASGSKQLTDEIQSLNEEKKAQKFEEISEVVQDKDHCHEKALNQDDLKAQTTVSDTPEVSKTQNEKGIQEHEDKDGIHVDKIERAFEEKHVEAIAETKPSNHIKASEKGHAQEAVSVDIKEHADETINDGTLGPERKKDETDGAKLENDFIVVSKEVEVTEGIANAEKENIDSKSPMNIEVIPKDDEAMCRNIEKVAAELIHEYQTTMTNDLSETGILIEKSDISEENVGDLPVAHKLEETIQVCENMDHIKQELEPANVEEYSKSASRHQSQMTIADTEATDLDSSGDGVSMDKTLSASSTIQASILGDSQKATDSEEAEEKICEKTNKNIGHDKHLEESPEKEAQKDIHKKIEDDKRVEDIILGDDQIDKTKAGLSSNQEQMEGRKLDKGDELKQGKETNEAAVNREICLEENPIVDAPENVHEDDKWGNKLEKPSDEIFVKIIMAQDSASNKEDLEKKGSPEEKEESSQKKGEAGVTLEQTVDRLHTKDLSNKPHGKDEKTSNIIGQNGDAEPARVKDEARIDSCVDELKQGKETNEAVVNREIEENPIADAPENVQEDDKWGSKLEKPSDDISVKISITQDSASNKEDLEKRGSLEEKEESSQEKREAGVTFKQTIDKLDTKDPSHKPHGKDEKTSSIIGQNGDAEPARVKDEAGNDSSVDELKQGKETDETVVNREIYLEENLIVDATKNIQKDDKWGNKFEKPSDEISVKVTMAQDSASNKEDVEKKGTPEEKQQSSQKKGEAGVTLDQIVDRLDTKDPSHKPDGKDEKTSSIIGQNGDAEPARVKDEAQDDSSVDELKQGKETDEALMNREICLEENPIVDAPEDDKWRNKLEKPSDEISMKIMMAQDSASNKEDVEKKGSLEEKKESSHEKGEAGVTLEQIVDRLDTKNPSLKPHGIDEKTSSIIGQNGDAEAARVKDEVQNGSSVEELKQGKETDEATVNREICLEENLIVDAPKNVQEDHKWGKKLEKPSDEISVKIMAQDSASNKEDVEKKGSLEEKKESSQEKGEAGVTLEQIVDGLDTEDPSHKPHGKDEKTSSIMGQNSDAEPTRVKDGAQNDSSVDELKQGKETNEDVVDREICLEKNSIVDAPENDQEDDKWGNKLEKPSDEISMKIIMAQDSASNKENLEKKGSPKEKEESSQEKDEAGVTLEQTVDKLDIEDPSHKAHGKDEKTSSIIGQNDDAEPAGVKDEARNVSSFDVSDTHELVGQCIDDLEGSKHEEVSNSDYEDQINEYTDTKGNKVVDDRERAPQKIEEISVSEDKNREITCETEATKIENLNTDYNLNNMVSETINTNGDNETAKPMNEEFLEKNIKDTPDSHTLATQEIHDAAGEKPESETIIESEEQIHQTTSNKDNIDTDICKEKADFNRLDSISESILEDQSGESDAPKVDNLADDDKLKIPAMGDLNDDHETAKVRYESILETSMDTISDSHASVLEKTYGRFDEKHKAPNLMSEEQIHQATNTEENKQVSVYNENIDIKRLEIVVKSGPEDQSPDKMTSKIEKTLDEDTINDTVNSLSILQASIEHTLQEEENPTVYAETIGVHKSTDHSISEEDKSSDSKSSGSSLDQSADRSVLKEEFNNDAILGSSLKHDVIENACELESEGKQHEAPKEKETSDIVLEESHGMTSDALERSTENLKGKQMIWEKEASENKASLSTECDFVEEGFQEDKEETKIMDLAPESAYNNKNNETNEVNDSMKSGIANKEVETSDDDKSHKASCSGKEYMLIKLQSEDNENANTKDEESTNNRANTNALGSEAASGSLHRGQRESITREEETIRNTKLDQEAASDLTSVEQHLEVIIKTDLANIDILEEDKCNLVAQYLESEVVNAKDEECISKTDGDLPTMPVPAKEVRWEIEEKHEKHPNYEEQIHERSITNNTMDNDALEEDKNIEEVERDVVRVPEEQSHEGTTTTGIIENEILKVALSASQKFDEEKTSKIAFLSEGNEHSCEAGEVCKKATCTLLKEAISIVEAASGTSMQSEVGADELNEDHISVFNRKFESLYPEKNQEEETPTRERASDACIAAPYNLVPVEPAFAARAQNMVDLNIEEWKAAKIMGKEVKDSVLACHENSQTSAETKSTENGPKDDALTVKTNSVEQNMQKDAHWVGSEDHIHDATEDHETTKCVALENRNKEEMEERKTLQSKKMEDEKQKERKELQADMEISEAFYPSECNNESLEEKGTLNKGSEKETLEVVELEKPLNAFNKMEESEFTDRFVPNKEEPEVERSLQAKEMKDEKQEEENKIQSKEKISEADNTSKCNKESSEEKRISERGAEKQKPDYVELENLQNVVPEELEVAYQTENINSDGQEKEVTDGSLEAGFHKKEDKALEEIVIELDVVNHCNEPNRDSDATEGVLEQEKILEVVDFSATKENQIKMFGRSSIKSDLVEEIKDVEPSGSHLQKESVESKALETEEKFESISFEEEPKKNEKLSVGSQNDANKVIQVEEVSNMVFDRLPTAGSSEKTEKKITSEDVEAPDVAHVRDKPFHEQIQGDENKTEIKKAETKWELEETDTIVNEILNDKVKELGYMPSKKNHAKVELPEKMDTTSPVDEEEPTKNVEFSSIKASSSEIMQDVSENLDKESVPKESTQIDAKTKVMGLEFANNMMNDEEGPIEIEKFEHISTNSVSVDRTCNRNSITPDANEKGEEAIDKEDREKLEEASNSVSNEKVDEWDDSLAAFIEDKDNSPNTPIKQATEVTTSADEKEMTWQTEGETHEKVRDFGNSENEENQQTDQDDLPVSRFLMDRILQEEGDKLAEACEAKCEDKLQVNIHDQQNDVNILKQERNSDSLSVEQEKDDTSISEGKVEDLIKIEGSSDLVQQSHDLKKDTENAILKDDETPDRNLHDTSLTLAAGEDLKDELSHLFDKELTNIISDNNMELVLAEECSPESKVDVDELKKLDNIIPIPAPEMMMESIIQKDDKSLKKNSDVATVIKAFEEDTLNKEGGKESPEISQDIAENDQASHATAEKQTPSVAEPVGNAKGEIQLKETVPNIQGDQPEKSFQSSSIEDSTLGEALETQSGGIKVKTGKENQDGTAESQMKNVKNNLSEELKVSDSHKVQQTEPIVEHTNETIQAGERFLTERSPAVSADEKHAKEIGDAHMKEEKNGEEKDEKEEEDENKTEESGHDAAIVVEARNADVKPAHKKSHNILSGVGSKVKHSIAKVKKAITGKSSHSKTQS